MDYIIPPKSLRRSLYLRNRPNYVIRFKATDVRRGITHGVFGVNGVQMRSEERDARDCAGVGGGVVTGAVFFVICLS